MRCGRSSVVGLFRDPLSRAVVRVRTHVERSLIAAVFVGAVVGLVACTPDVSGTTLSANTRERVCQLTGDTDWVTHMPTTSQTVSRFGFRGTDLGYPVEHAGRLALLFGDSRFNRPDVANAPPRDDTPENRRPDDAIGWVTTPTPPTASRCLAMTIEHEPNNSHVAVSPVVGPPFIKQGLFNVPSGGVSTGGSLYGFFWTDHCLYDDRRCANIPTLNRIGRGVLARYHDAEMRFIDPVPLPRDFVYATAIDATALTGVPEGQRLGVYIVAVPDYRHSIPYLAYAAPGQLADPTGWKFFIGRTSDDQPSWTSYDVWIRRGQGAAPPGRPELFETDSAGRCVGELSVTWNQPLGVWLMLYNCGPPKDARIMARVAAAPWGLWSRETLLLDPAIDTNACQLMWKVPGHGNGCDARKDEWYGNDAGKINGGLYAPFVMERYSARVKTVGVYRKSAMVYWLLSTYNPYQVDVMRTVLTVESPPTRASAVVKIPVAKP